MDIASVYLNLTSLLGTEIEVEGYHFWGALYTGERERESLRLVLPRYVNREGLMSVNHALNEGDHWTKITVRGYLTQNRQGEPLLDAIFSIRYKTQHVNYKADLTCEDQTITCAMQSTLTVNPACPSAGHQPFKKTFFMSGQVSKAVLLEGALMPPFYQGNQNFSVVINDQVSSVSDMVQQILNRLFFLVVGVPVTIALNWRGNLKIAVRAMIGGKHRFCTRVWFHNQASEFLNQYFGLVIPGGYDHWMNKDIQFLFAGQVAWIDRDEKKAHHLPKHYHLKFASLDYVQLNYTITFQRAQDE